MLEILQQIISVLINTSAVTALVPATQILTGPVDITMQKQKELLYPQINLRVISEVQRSNPLHTRDTQVQIDIWSRNNQLELENIYEAVLTALEYMTVDKGTAHIFWSRLGGAVDDYEADRRIWHRSCTFTFWSMKPTP